MEPLALEVGLGLVKLVEGAQNSPLLRRIAGIRRQMVADLGYMVPPVRVTDNLQLKANEYVVLLKGAEIARFELIQNCELAIHSGRQRGAVPLEGIADERAGVRDSRRCGFGRGKADNARAKGYTVVDAVSVLGTHLAELIRRHAFELLSRQDTKNILDRVAEENPKVIEDLVPKLLPMAIVQKVFQNLLRERVSIRDAVTILEALGEAAAMTKNPILLTEYARQAIRRLLVKPYLNPVGRAAGVLRRFANRADHRIARSSTTRTISHINLAPQKIREILDRVIARGGRGRLADGGGHQFCGALFSAADDRRVSIPNLSILSHNEIPSGVRVVSVGSDSMKLKSYFSGTVEAAVELARKELGEDALLVNARPATPETRHLGAYEVVFGAPTANGRSKSRRPGHRDRLAQDVAEMRREIERLAQSAARGAHVHGSARLASELRNLLAPDRERAGRDARAAGRARDARSKICSKWMRRWDGAARTRGVIALVGPPGVGKTTTLVEAGGAFRSDVAQAGAHSFRRRLPHRRGGSAAVAGRDSGNRLRRGGNAGRRWRRRWKSIAPRIWCSSIRPVLAQRRNGRRRRPGAADRLSSGDRHAPGAVGVDEACGHGAGDRPVRRFSSRQKLLFTRLDETERFGALVNEAARRSAALSFLATGQQIPDDLEPATKEWIRALVLSASPEPWSPARTARSSGVRTAK